MNKILTTILITLLLVGATVPAEAGILSRKGDCGFKVVSYRVQGEPGDSFRYAGKTFTIPMHGTIEIVAEKHDHQIQIDQQVVDLGERKPDDFGIVDVRLDVEQTRVSLAAN